MFHSVELRAHCHATEEEARVEKALRTLCPDGTIETERAEGHHGNPILLMRCRIQKDDVIAGFWSRVKDAGLVDKILESLEERIDEDAVLHLRFDKQKAFAGTIELAQDDDVIAVWAKVAAHPAKKSVAVRIAREYLRRL
jgi:RNA binding exosome subunit